MRVIFVVVFMALFFTSCSDSKSETDDHYLDSDNTEVTDNSEQSDEVKDDKDVVDKTDNEDVDDKDEVDVTDSEDVDDKDVVDVTDNEDMDDKDEVDTTDAEDIDVTDNEVDDETVDLSDEASDAKADEMPDEDTITSDHVEVINNADGSVTVNVTLNSATDAVTSYLMDSASSSWNYFHGSSVNVGFRVYSALDDQYVAYHSAFRFTDVDVPAGATIESANFSFHPTNEVDSSKKVYLRAAMEKSINSAEFDVSNYTTNRPDQRTETDATVEEILLKCMELDDCYDPESSYCKDRAKDCWDRETRFTFRGELSDMVQEIIDTTGWTKKNAMTVFITGTYPSAMSSGEKPDYSNNRSVTGYDTAKVASYYPVLSITFTVK